MRIPLNRNYNCGGMEWATRQKAVLLFKPGAHLRPSQACTVLGLTDISIYVQYKVHHRVDIIIRVEAGGLAQCC